MTKKSCDCANPPLVKIKFGSRLPNDKVYDTIIPLGIVLPDGDDLVDFQNNIKPWEPKNSDLPSYQYKDDERLEQLKFKISVDYCTIKNFELTIKADGVSLFTQPVTQIDDSNGAKVSTLPCGDYFWEWDGYADLSKFTSFEPEGQYHDEYSNNSLNTFFLKRANLSFHFKYFYDSSKSGEVTKKFVYKSRDHDNDWIDMTVINKNSPNLRLYMRPTLPDKIPSPHEPGRGYQELLAMSRVGLEMLWRRNGADRDVDWKGQQPYWKIKSCSNLHDLKVRTTTGVKEWRLTSRASIASHEGQQWYSDDCLPLQYNRRSYSAGPGKNISYLAELIDKARTDPTTLPQNRQQAIDDSTKAADLWFIETAAHEIGHNILDDAYGIFYSWNHKKTSYICGFGRSANRLNRYDCMINARSSGGKVELDLMRYWDGAIWFNSQLVAATEDDSRGAIWLCQVKFNLE